MHLPRFSEEKNLPHALRYATIYICFLLVCLMLGLFLALSTSNHARAKYWAFHSTNLELDISQMDSDLAMMENYARQLSTDSTFVRFSNMEGLEEPGFAFTAYQIMRNLSLRQYGLSELPAKSHIYLPRSGYVISPSQFTERSQFYRYYLSYPAELEEEWVNQLQRHGALGTCFSLEPFGQSPSDVTFAYDIGAMLSQPVHAIVWYELDTNLLRKRFLFSGAPDATLLIVNEHGSHQLTLTGDGQMPDDALLVSITNAAYNKEGFVQQDGMQYIRRSGANGWTYYLALPVELSAQALGKFPLFYLSLFLSALLFGAVMVILLVRESMKPLNALSLELSIAQSDNARMRRTMEAQRPALCATYLRTLLSGHVASDEEFAYMMRFLELAGDYRYFVLFSHAFHTDGLVVDARQAAVIKEHIRQHLSAALPPQHYTTTSNEYIILVAYPLNADNAAEDLALRVQALHTALLEKHGLWFFAGAGLPCHQPRLLWESYEQARHAFRCMTKSHVFLSYAALQKDAESWYYPIEISAKLLHFITTGNHQQVSELFSLIHRENIEERRLSIQLLKFLLSDLKNTLLKARFQIARPSDDAARLALTTLDQQLYHAESFQDLDACARLLCSFFTKAAEPSDPIPEIQRYLHENFSDPSLCLSKLSGLFNISESYLSHLFKDRTGENFSTYLENLRMDEAQKRLAQGGCSLSTLYAELGYTNPTTWRRAFKKRFGMTPSEMIAQNK